MIGLVVALVAAGWLWNKNRHLDQMVTDFASGKIIPFNSYHAHRSLAFELNELMIKKDPIPKDDLLDLLKSYKGLNGLCTDVPCTNSLCCDGIDVPGIIVTYGDVFTKVCAKNIQVKDENGTVIQCPEGVIYEGDLGVVCQSNQLIECGASLVISNCPFPTDTLWRNSDIPKTKH